ncbi:MAG TPA: carbamoyl phosphate synthase large subunit, partial [bacterium]|nr:carbamoyl phosphate synthase large subunit [bacterium]
GPEMKSTGEVIGLDVNFGLAYAKSQLAAGQFLPLSGSVFLSVKDKDKPALLPLAIEFSKLGFKIIATRGTAHFLARHGIRSEIVHKVYEGERPNVADFIRNNLIQLIINTSSGMRPKKDTLSIRSLAVSRSIPLITTIPGAMASLMAIKALREREIQVYEIHECYRKINFS